MAVHNAKNMTTARKQAMKARKMGYNATVYKTKKRGASVSVTRM